MTIAATGSGTVRPMFFGDPAAELFGCLHSAADPCGSALVVQPVMHEYMGSHRTLVQLAARLAAGGISTLRYDSRGTGDSAGESGDGGPTEWESDVTTAAAELVRQAGQGHPSIAGLRLGATLALLRQCGPGASPAPALVLWDPVVSGKTWVEELLAREQERFGGLEDEVLGFPLGPALRAQLEAIDLRTIGCPAVRRVLVAQTSGSVAGEIDALVARLEAVGTAVERRAFDAPPFWRDPGKTFVPRPVIDAIVAWMKGAAA
jgi:pimeloyl-ACP methyl ester carboxylesterase